MSFLLRGGAVSLSLTIAEPGLSLSKQGSSQVERTFASIQGTRASHPRCGSFARKVQSTLQGITWVVVFHGNRIFSWNEINSESPCLARESRNSASHRNSTSNHFNNNNNTMYQRTLSRKSSCNRRTSSWGISCQSYRTNSCSKYLINLHSRKSWLPRVFPEGGDTGAPITAIYGNTVHSTRMLLGYKGTTSACCCRAQGTS